MKAFFVYPSQPAYISDQITQAVGEIAATGPEVQTWQENDICGRPLVEPILEHISNADIVVADITKLNFNVTFEIGYAIAKGKRVYIVRSKDTPLDELIAEVGIYDTLGYKTYKDAEQLTAMLGSMWVDGAIPTAYAPDRRSPIFIVLPRRPDELVSALHSRLKKTGYPFRSFNALEETRLAAVEAIEHTLSSQGVALPLLNNDHPDVTVHNMRCAFVAGLAYGADIPVLITQHHGGPVPADIKDFAESIRHPKDLVDHVHTLAVAVTNRMLAAEGRPPPNLTALAKLTIGDPMAENELDTIDEYFLQTDEYLRTERGEVRLVVGRKGTGKTAIFGHLARQKSANPKNVVIDLKPEGYQLVKLRDNLLVHLAQGTKYHLLVAFWEMILYLEICNRILVDDERRHLNDHRLFEKYNLLKARYMPYLSTVEADFSERLSAVSDSVISNFESVRRSGEEEISLSTEKLTNLLYTGDIRAIREDVKGYMSTKTSACILFDNLDRGWPETGLTSDDVLLIKSLIDASAKIQKEMRQKQAEFSSVVFLRNDVYQILMHSTPDFGKDMRAQLDWTDIDQIKEMIRLRLAVALNDSDVEFDSAWHHICASHIEGEETFSYLVDRSLFRPRNVLKLIYHCRASAINARRDRIEEGDIEKGVNAFSQDILIEADRELSDVMPIAKGLIYFFMGENCILSRGEIFKLLLSTLNEVPVAEEAIERLLYFGFIGLERKGSIQYIYNVGYNMKIFQAELQKFQSEIRFIINPAFWPALYINQN